MAQVIERETVLQHAASIMTQQVVVLFYLSTTDIFFKRNIASRFIFWLGAYTRKATACATRATAAAATASP
jgi:hypothetical protein